MPGNMLYAILAFIISLVVTFLVSYLTNKIVGNPNKATLITLGMLALLFFYNLGFMAIEYLLISRIKYFGYYANTTAIIVLTLMLVTFSKLIINSGKTFDRSNKYLLIMFMLFFFISLASIDTNGREIVKLRNQINIDKIKDTSKTKPNIYYIIVDSYTSPKSLSEYWNYKDTLLTNFLLKKGFYIAEESRSEYTSTIYSLNASMNMSYLEYDTTNGHAMYLSLEELIKYNKVNQILGKLGYRFYNYSLFDIYKQEKFYNDIYFKPSFVWLSGTLLEKILSRINAHLRPEWQSNLEIKRNLVKNNLESNGAPIFVYAHFMMPHFPYYFRSDGTIIDTKDELLNQSEKNAYLEQLKFTNKVLVDITNNILERSKANTVIIIQGDHGFRFLSGKNEKKESHTILNAYYFPDHDYKLLTPNINPVNSFRVVFKKYFGAEIELLKN